MKLIDLINIPEDFDKIKLLLPTLGSKCVASRYDQSPKHVFEHFAFGNTTYFIGPPGSVKRI